MLLCIGPSNQEVQDLPAAINNWISLTQGASPEERRGHEPTLFFILTKMDMEFERKQGVEDVSNRWNTRLQSSLTNFFGVQFDWPENWDGRPFRNMYLMRNPNFRCDAIFTFSADGTETGIRPDMKDYVEEVKQSFLKSPLVLEHFENPAEAWDAAMKLNDGGIDLLRRKLAPICDPNRKYNQTLDRGTATARRIAGRLAPYYRSGDSEKLRKEKEIQAQKLLRVVASIIERQQFADLQSRLQIDDFTLYQLAEDCADQASTDESGAAAPGTVVGSSISASGLMDDLFGDAAGAQGHARGASRQRRPAGAGSGRNILPQGHRVLVPEYARPRRQSRAPRPLRRGSVVSREVYRRDRPGSPPFPAPRLHDQRHPRAERFQERHP